MVEREYRVRSVLVFRNESDAIAFMGRRSWRKGARLDTIEMSQRIVSRRDDGDDDCEKAE